jgi:hypothetical protein
MKYSTMIVALIFGLAGNAHATQYDPAESESDTDDRVACIESAIVEEVEDGSQFDQYVEACFQDKLAQKKKSAEQQTGSS